MSEWISLAETASFKVLSSSYLDPSHIALSFAYSDDLTEKHFEVLCNFSSSQMQPFKQLDQSRDLNFTVVHPEFNNMALYPYSNPSYTQAQIVSYLAMLISALGIIGFFAGFLGPKVIALDLLDLIQVTYFSLIGIQHLSPGMAALSGLKYSSGYAVVLFPEPAWTAETARFFGIGMSVDFLNNFNIMAGLPLVAVLCGLAAKLVAKISPSERDFFWNFISARALCEFALYALMISLNAVVVSMGVEFYFQREIAAMVAAGLAFAAFVVYFVLLEEYPEKFGEFKKKFAFAEWPQKYFNLLMVLRLVAALVLSFSWMVPFFNGVIIASAVFQFCLICKAEPFKIPERNLRPRINCVLMALIQAVFLLFSVVEKPYFEDSFLFYAPFLILGLLLVAVAVNFHRLFQETRENLESFRTLREKYNKTEIERKEEKRILEEPGLRSAFDQNLEILRAQTREYNMENLEEDYQRMMKNISPAPALNLTGEVCERTNSFKVNLEEHTIKANLQAVEEN